MDKAKRHGIGGGRQQKGSLQDIVESAVVGLLLLAAVVSAISGSAIALFVAVLAAWIILPLVVGVRNTLDAGCVFMLITIGTLLVVGLAQHGPSYLIP